MGINVSAIFLTLWLKTFIKIKFLSWNICHVFVLLYCRCSFHLHGAQAFISQRVARFFHKCIKCTLSGVFHQFLFNMKSEWNWDEGHPGSDCCLWRGITDHICVMALLLVGTHRSKRAGSTSYSDHFSETTYSTQSASGCFSQRPFKRSGGRENHLYFQFHVPAYSFYSSVDYRVQCMSHILYMLLLHLQLTEREST